MKIHYLSLSKRVSLSQVLAFSFYIVFPFNALAVENNIGECTNPVAKEDASRGVAEREVLIDVPVPEDEAVDRRVRLEIVLRELYTILVLGTFERSVSLYLMLQHAVARPAMPHP